MRIKDLGFRQRFVLVSLLFLLGFAAILIVGWRTLDRVRVNGALYDRVVQDKDIIADIIPPPRYIVEPYVLTYGIAVSPDRRAERLGQLDRDIQAFRQHGEHWREVLPAGALKTELLDTAGRPAEAFLRILEDEFLPAVRGGGDVSTEALEIIRTKLDPLFEEHRRAIMSAVRMAEQNITRHEEEASSAVREGVLWTLGTAGIVVLVVSVLAMFLMRSVLTSMNTIIGRMREMALADADLNARLDIESNDEVGTLAHWINAFVEKIAGLIAAVKKSSIQLTSTATEMTATSREQESTVNSFGASTNQIAAAVKEISATGAELMSTMHEVNAAAHQASSLATSGRDGLTAMGSTMTDLAESSSSISSKLAVINEKANDINLVVTTITKVADQTNLLSVNAAIESEKAGEYGRGFLVVAREIRRLADQTAAATLDIEETVGQMQSAVSAGVMEMDKFADQVRRSVATMQEVIDQLGGAIEQVQANTRRFEIVTDGMASQSQGAQQIDEAMSALSGNVQQTVTSLQEFTAAADDLRRAVDALKGEIGKFRLEN